MISHQPRIGEHSFLLATISGFGLFVGMQTLALVLGLDPNPPLWGSVSLVEMVWVVVNAISLVFVWVDLRLAWEDVATNATAGVLPDRRDVRNALLFVWLVGGYLVVGILAALADPPQIREVKLVNILLADVLISGAVAIAVVSYLNVREARAGSPPHRGKRTIRWFG